MPPTRFSLQPRAAEAPYQPASICTPTDAAEAPHQVTCFSLQPRAAEAPQQHGLLCSPAQGKLPTDMACFAAPRSGSSLSVCLYMQPRLPTQRKLPISLPLYAAPAPRAAEAPHQAASICSPGTPRSGSSRTVNLPLYAAPHTGSSLSACQPLQRKLPFQHVSLCSSTARQKFPMGLPLTGCSPVRAAETPLSCLSSQLRAAESTLHQAASLFGPAQPKLPSFNMFLHAAAPRSGGLPVMICPAPEALCKSIHLSPKMAVTATQAITLVAAAAARPPLPSHPATLPVRAAQAY